MSSSRLEIVAVHLASLRRARERECARQGLSALGLATGWLLVGLFLADWCLKFQRLERGLLLTGLLAMMTWGAVRWLWHPWRQLPGTRELAIELDRQTQLDGALIDALQFDAGPPGRFGSPLLEEQVISRVAARRNWPRL
ncbi:MAG: hypothetical protein ACKV0T_07640, partial [Planctomycetales bacterium]